MFHETISSMHCIQEQLRKEAPKPAVKAMPKPEAPAENLGGSVSIQCYPAGFDPVETLTSRGCVRGVGTLLFGDGQKRGLAARLVCLG